MALAAGNRHLTVFAKLVTILAGPLSRLIFQNGMMLCIGILIVFRQRVAPGANRWHNSRGLGSMTFVTRHKLVGLAVMVANGTIIIFSMLPMVENDITGKTLVHHPYRLVRLLHRVFGITYHPDKKQYNRDKTGDFDILFRSHTNALKV